MPRLHRALAAALCATVLLTACGNDDEAAPAPTVSATARPTRSPSPTPTPSATPTGPLHPLAGTLADDAQSLDRPVLAVKIENSAASRPQTGLEVADVVFEELVEGGVTRFMALFQSQVPEELGPVRSARLVDVDLLPAYAPIFAISGARNEVMDALGRAGVTTLADGVGFYRDRAHGKSAPHNLYASGPRLYERGSGRDAVGEPPADWSFRAAVPSGAVDCGRDVVCADAARSFSVAMSTIYSTGWEYDASAGLYRRLQNGAPFEVTGDGLVGAANVVVLGMSVGPGACCDPGGAPLVKTQVIGTGRGIVLRDGRWFEIVWRKGARDAPMMFHSAVTDEILPLKPGPTWVLLAPIQNLPEAPANASGRPSGTPTPR